VRRGQCQLCGTVPPTFVRLTRQALEGGRRNPRMGANAFSMTTQDYAVTSGRREWSSPSLLALCGYPRHCSTTPGGDDIPNAVEARRDRTSPRPLLTVNSCIKVRLDLQADKSPVVVKGPFFPRVVNPRYRIRGIMCNARIQSSKAR
jgi:hypothetical protein